MSISLKGKSIIVGVTGGIAAYKTCEIVSSLIKRGAEVNVIMTANAARFVAPLTFETLSNNRVTIDTFDRDFEYNVKHISLAKKADAFVVAPCTANFAAKFANGIADDFLSTTVMAVSCPVILAPAMNTGMLNSPAYKQNADTLKKRGVIFVGPSKGRLACGDDGDGRMSNPSDILTKIDEVIFPKNDFAGKTVLITAGATREPIDPVRFISNYSSGKMGVMLAEACEVRGAKVIFVHGNISVLTSASWDLTPVTSTLDMYNAVVANLDKADIIIKAAAPADYKIAAKYDQKQKATKLTINLEKTPDIASYVGKNKGKKKLVIFSAETEKLVDNAKKKLIAKNADLVVANDVTQDGAGFEVDTNIATIISKDKSKSYDKMSKRELADIILDWIV